MTFFVVEYTSQLTLLRGLLALNSQRTTMSKHTAWPRCDRSLVRDGSFALRRIQSFRVI